jgi:beta-lactam-binding protein with PASTA domain
MTTEAATKRLQGAGLDVTTRTSLALAVNWPPGVVVSMEPDAASRVTRVPRGTTITLTAAAGTATTPNTVQVVPSHP